MILEFNLDYRSSSQVYEKIFLKMLKKFGLNGNIEREHLKLKLHVESDNTEILEAFATDFSEALPHSIFLHESDARMVEQMKQEPYEIEEERLALPFCPQCLKEVMDPEHENYYNIFTSCDVCGYGIEGEKKSYKSYFEKTAKEIKSGKTVALNTFYGNYVVGIPSAVCNSIICDVVVYDLATVEKYANVESYEISTLGAMEKPFIKLKKKIAFTMDHEEVTADLIRFKLPDDFILHLLMEELHLLGVDAIFITDEEMEADTSLCLVEAEEHLEPIEVVASENDVAIVSGEKGLPEFAVHATEVNPGVGSFYSVIKEHNLQEETVAGVHVSKIYQNSILIYGQKYGLVEYLSLNFNYSSMKEIFAAIAATNDSGEKILENYRNKFPEHFAAIEDVVFKNNHANIFSLWGIVSIVLGYAETDDLLKAAEALEANAMSFLGSKGPRIDYKLINVKGKTQYDPLMTIRTAMSFKLAGVDQLMLSYGVIESFLEFIANELDEVKQSMDITAVTVTGSLLGNKHLFSKMSKEIGMNHTVYFNNELSVEGNSMFYGGTSLS